MATEGNADGGVSAPLFPLTHWSVVLGAGHGSSPGAEAALEQLCRTYWYPLYAYLRRSGHNEADAQDLIQSFFASLIEREWVAAADPAKGRFRSFLLTCLKRFVSVQAQKAHALKRGGRKLVLSLDDQNAAERYALESLEDLAPEVVFDRRWALTLLAACLGSPERGMRGDRKAGPLCTSEGRPKRGSSSAIPPTSGRQAWNDRVGSQVGLVPFAYPVSRTPPGRSSPDSE